MLRRRKCPFCASEADAVIYGMLVGPPGPGEVAGGCVIFPGHNPDFVCPVCQAEWLRDPSGVKAVVSFGTNPVDKCPSGYFSIDDLVAAGVQARIKIDELNEHDVEAVHTVLVDVGTAIGLTPKQSRILMDYL